MSDREIEKVISAFSKFPCKITASEGRKLKQFFEQPEQIKTKSENIKSLRSLYHFKQKFKIRC